MPLGFTPAAERMGLEDALPCALHELPRPLLSESILVHARLLPWIGRIPTLYPYLDRLHRLVAGKWRARRLTA